MPHPATTARTAPAPLFTDPVHHAPTDPTVVAGPAGPTGRWFMFYTQRRAEADGPGVTWVHGTDIAVATSDDGGLTWAYRGAVEGLDPHAGRNTLWAPEVTFAEGRFHMFLSYITGVPDRWAGHARRILHHVSDDLEHWEYRGEVPLSSDRVIDACTYPLPGGGHRIWFKDEAAGSATWCADSVPGSSLERWGPARPVITGDPHEGPNVFALGGAYWMIVDEWHGQAVYRSADLEDWTRDGLILDAPGRRDRDATFGHHADVVVGTDPDGVEAAWIFYFTHDVQPHGAQGRALEAERERGGGVPATRYTAVQVATATVVDGHLVCDRDEPVALDLRRALVG
ncbi:glycosyl hydrolase [Occultella kanbiaonis]|uniref:glycosyl hydrolase n=1 Tax=Occultella kanbiaonis TaxID=2675754 RepID=UPI0012B8214A|nr:glycosyl hydrolase [Occultella kanbiaonis]